MTTLAALAADVYGLTNRPDLTVETNVAIKAATLKAHQMEYFPKDLFETGIIFTAADYTQQLTYKSVVPTWRSLKYLRKYDNTTTPGVPGREFTLITPDNALDDYGIDKVDVMYLAGTVINIKSSDSFQYALLGCYILPDITDLGYSSWIADEHPYCIEFEAARVLFKTIGFDEQSAAYNELVKEQYDALKISQILANGY